jgi:hypothetical protein
VDAAPQAVTLLLIHQFVPETLLQVGEPSFGGDLFFR